MTEEERLEYCKLLVKLIFDSQMKLSDVRNELSRLSGELTKIVVLLNDMQGAAEDEIAGDP